MNTLELLRFPFVQYALIVSVLMAVCASLIGVPLVLKRYSFMGFGLSNVAFMGMALAIIVDAFNPMAIVMPFTIAATIILIGFGNRFKKISRDASLAMITVGSLAVGHFAINTFSMRGNITADVSETLFGGMRLLTLDMTDVWQSVGITVFVLLFFVFFYHRIFAVTFDVDFMQATGQRPLVYELALSAITGIVIAVSMNLLGSLLTAALIIFPALSAMRLFRAYKSVIIFATIAAACCSLLGILISIIIELPVTTTIILVNIALFFILLVVDTLYKMLA
ncbi:MAG: metal ABC transporter permease [Defluviitaleaceae bacterium]|nr:metal ABC transporter permease [Defluviitaleaceae bacterium]